MLPKNFQKKTKSPNDNLTQTDKNFIKQFSKRNDLVMTKVDKGGAGVILDIKDYVAKADEQLEDNSFYQKVNVDPIAKYSECYRKFQKTRTIIKLDSKQTHHR